MEVFHISSLAVEYPQYLEVYPFPAVSIYLDYNTFSHLIGTETLVLEAACTDSKRNFIDFFDLAPLAGRSYLYHILNDFSIKSHQAILTGTCCHFPNIRYSLVNTFYHQV